jgi:mediator of RNA polymerase II transcription subunit 31
MASDANRDISMGSSPPPVPATDDEPKYGGYSRFEIELEVRIERLSWLPCS